MHETNNKDMPETSNRHMYQTKNRDVYDANKRGMYEASSRMSVALLSESKYRKLRVLQSTSVSRIAVDPSPVNWTWIESTFTTLTTALYLTGFSKRYELIRAKRYFTWHGKWWMKRTFSSSKKTKGLTWHVWFTKMVGIANGILKSPNAFRRFGLTSHFNSSSCSLH